MVYILYKGIDRSMKAHSKEEGGEEDAQEVYIGFNSFNV